MSVSTKTKVTKNIMKEQIKMLDEKIGSWKARKLSRCCYLSSSLMLNTNFALLDAVIYKKIKKRKTKFLAATSIQISRAYQHLDAVLLLDENS